MKKRSILELYRLLATIAILIHHSYTTGAAFPHFHSAYIFVEFFFILSGYFTMAHFAKKSASQLEDVAKDSLGYTFKKFSRIIPYILIPVIATAVMKTVMGQATSDDVQGVILECLLLRAGIHGEHISNIPLWYLSTMLILFPAFCCLCQVKSKNFLYILAGTICALLYGYTPMLSNSIAPLSIVRTFTGLMLGIVVYGFADFISKNEYCKTHGTMLTVVEIVCVVCPLAMTWFNISTLHLYILCFAVGLALTLSGVTHTGNLSVPFLDKIGNFILSVYTWQWVVGGGINKILVAFFSLDEALCFPVYMVATFIAAACNCIVVDWVRKVLSRKKQAAVQ